MAITAFRNMKPFSQLFFTVFVIFVSFVVFMILSLIVAIPMFGLNPVLDIASATNFNDPETLRMLKFFQVVQSIGLFIIPPFIVAILFYGNIREYLHLNSFFSINSLFLVVILMLFVAPFVNFIGEINQQMHLPEWMSGVERWMKNSEEQAAQLTEAFLKMDTFGALLFNIIMIAVLPAIGEELLFRGVFQRIFADITHSHHGGIWIAAALFSAMHMQFYGFIPRLLLGVLFGYLLVWSGSMWLPIVAHFVNNALATIAVFMVDKGMVKPEVEDIGSTAESYYVAAISLVATVVLLWLIKKGGDRQKA
ncbi:MAG: hypothetical protein CSA36_02935 [Draconibacterium sp.]|nr:MAG: hypothetical protein CSA36_02935 [Draconibacterium sp.]